MEKIETNISVLVPPHVESQEVEDLIENTGGKLLWSTDMTSFYDGPDLGEAEKVSFTFRLTFKKEKGSVSKEEADELTEKIKKALKSKGWEVK